MANQTDSGTGSKVHVTRLMLDVLKPHHPNALDFACMLAACGPDLQVNLVVQEMDDKTETLLLEITGKDIDFKQLHAAINEQGGSLHSIDEVSVHSVNQAYSDAL